MKALSIFIILLSAVACNKTTTNNYSVENSMSSVESLGQKLFFDPRLSSDGTISCNSCHNVMNGGVDNRQFSMGVKGQLGGRNSPTVFNAKFLSVQFWDGRAKDLADQAKGPLTNPIEMGNKDHNQVMSRLKLIPGYVLEFKEVFGEGGMNIDNLALAIGAYEETLTTLNSPYDKNTMTAAQLKGQETFKEMGCTACHSGDHFAGPTLPTGTGFYQKFPTMPNTASDLKYAFTKDKGRFEATNNPSDMHMFRVPTLRNIALTSPYFHNGSVKDLREAVRVMGETQLGKKLNETQISEIVDFLNALTGTVPTQVMPVLHPTPGTTVAEGF